MIDWQPTPKEGIGCISEVLFWFVESDTFAGSTQHAIYYDGWNFASSEVHGIYNKSNGAVISHWAPLNVPVKD